MRVLVWLFRFAVFFVLLAFALNNQHDARILWFFGQEWHTRMVFVVFAAFAFGCAFGVVAMVPSWWRHRRVARKHNAATRTSGDGAALAAVSDPAELTPPAPIRDGL